MCRGSELTAFENGMFPHDFLSYFALRLTLLAYVGRLQTNKQM